METIQTPTNAYGWFLFLSITAIFVLNFLFARYMTLRLVQCKYVKKKSPEFEKTFVLWFFPIVGGLGLWMLLWTFHTIKFWKSFSKWLLLKHA
jgi:hypothetical protein